MKITRAMKLACAVAGIMLVYPGCDDTVPRETRNWVNDPPRMLLVANDALMYVYFPSLSNTAKVVTVQGIAIAGRAAADQLRFGSTVDLPDPDEWEFDPWDLPDPTEDLPLPEPPTGPWDDPFDDLPSPIDLPPFPDDEMDLVDANTGDLSIIDFGGDSVGHSNKPRAASVQNAARQTRIRVGASPGAIRLTADRKRTYVAQSGGIGVVDRVNRVMVETIPLPASGRPYGLTLTPDETRAYVSSFVAQGAEVYAVDLVAKKLLATIPVGGYPAGIAMSPDGTQVWVTSFFTDSVTVIDTLTNEKVVTMNGITNAWSITFNRTGSRVYVTASEAPFGSVKVIDTDRYAVTASIQVENSPRSLALTPSGNHLMVANFGGDSVSQIDTNTNKVVRTIRVGRRPAGFVFR